MGQTGEPPKPQGPGDNFGMQFPGLCWGRGVGLGEFGAFFQPPPVPWAGGACREGPTRTLAVSTQKVRFQFAHMSHHNSSS